MAAVAEILETCVEEGNAFVEVQRFRQWWIWLVLVVDLALMLVLFGYGMFQQLVQNQPWGDRPMSDNALVLVGSAAILFSLGLLSLFLVARLEITVGPEALSIRFRPFSARRIPYGDIASVEARTYRPLVEYGGWGIRWSLSRGMAYNVSGKQGVLLQLSNGSRVLLGSRNAQSLADAIKQKIDNNG